MDNIIILFINENCGVCCGILLGNFEGIQIKWNLNVTPLRAYDFVIGMDCLDGHHSLIHCKNHYKSKLVR
jgi:hypothetical protein